MPKKKQTPEQNFRDYLGTPHLGFFDRVRLSCGESVVQKLVNGDDETLELVFKTILKDAFGNYGTTEAAVNGALALINKRQEKKLDEDSFDLFATVIDALAEARYQAGADGFDCSIAENGEITVSILADKKTKTRAAIIFPPEECHKLLEPGTDIVKKVFRLIAGKPEGEASPFITAQHAPDNYRYPTDKETRLILSGAIIPDGEALPIKGTGSYITVFPAEDETGAQYPLTTEQYSIMIAIAQTMISEKGSNASGVWITPDQIFRIMLADDSVRLKPENREDIIAAVRYMMSHLVEIHDKSGHVIRANMIFGYEVENKKLENGNPVKLAWFIKEMPVFMMYAYQRGQICAIPKPVVALPSGVKYTDKNLAIRDYLLREIEWMKYTKKHPEKKTGKRTGTRILFNSVFEGCQMPELSNMINGERQALTDTGRSTRSKYIAKIKKFCDHFSNTGEIAGYTAENDGISIIFPA